MENSQKYIFENDINYLNKIIIKNNKYFDYLKKTLENQRKEIYEKLILYKNCLTEINNKWINIKNESQKLELLYDYKIILNSVDLFNINYKPLIKIKKDLKSIDKIRISNKSKNITSLRNSSIIKNPNYNLKIELSLNNLHYWNKIYKKNNKNKCLRYINN